MANIFIKGAKEHNLKNIDVEIQRYKIVVVTGLSGSGKSSLVMDTLYAEGQRRYVESLSSYARQFLGLMEKPDVDHIEGLSPAIAIDQKSGTKNPRSTVGTITEIYDYLRLAFARIGQPHCPKCRTPISKQSISSIIDRIEKKYNNKKLIILSPIIKGIKGEHKEIMRSLTKEGFLRARIDGEITSLENDLELQRYQMHTIEVVIDRLMIKEGVRSRLADSIETAMKMGKGSLIIHSEDTDEVFSEKFACTACGYSYKELSPRLFSFNSPYGACPKCDGLGSCPTHIRQLPRLMYRYQKTQSLRIKEKIEETMSEVTCPSCSGSRLNKEALSVFLNKKNIDNVSTLSIEDLKYFFESLKLNKQESVIAEKIKREILARINFLIDVGLGYLSLSRTAGTLSGGESQRIRLATQIGSGLVNVLYVLDEPSIGLHQKDNDRLLLTLENLRNAGNTLVIIEHDEDTMKRADQIIDLGPKAGIHGGKLIFSGSYQDILKCKQSLTGQYLSGKECISIPKKRRVGNDLFLSIKNARLNNLKNLDVAFPLGKFICITGVSGSGKSSLINNVLYEGLNAHLNRKKIKVSLCDGFEGVENIDKMIVINQAPIGRTPRSNPATYAGFFNYIRDLFARLPAAQMRGYSPGRFSFNVKGGRCESCEGSGRLKIEMHFMPDIYITCDECKGTRFNKETLDILFKGKNISDVLNMTVEEAFIFFENIPSIKTKLETLCQVGLSYIQLSQSATTLSGGEAQRIKLAKELSKPGTGKTLYILDEPTTGLHFADIAKLLGVLNRLIDKGNTIIVIEHNLDVIKVSDHIIDLGPNGGDKGGQIIVEGTPEKVAKETKSYTGHYLKSILQ